MKSYLWGLIQIREVIYKTKYFESYYQYQAWIANARNNEEIELVTVTDMNGSVLVTYLAEE
jgi:hypothetical protein